MIRNIARALKVASYSYDDQTGQILHLINQGSHLIEKVYDDEELIDQRMVANGVRENGPAAYVKEGDRVFAFYIKNDGGFIMISEFDPDSEEWDDAEFYGLEDADVHDESKLSVAKIPEFNVILFQDSNDSIRARMSQTDSYRWETEFIVPGDAKSGTPIASFPNDNALVVSFFEEDGMLHIHSRDFETGKWTDDIIAESFFDDPVDNLIVTQAKESDSFDAFVLNDGRVYHISRDGTRETVGSFNQDGDFVLDANAVSDTYHNNEYGSWRKFKEFNPYENSVPGSYPQWD
ncbi:hypothetical protein FLONG3_5350 [Fusarium longipes]|uniref:Uncharacterized protein n=1 Tax=Fusarium longipes TaxID=694270 RepID=A0A395SUV9_9HYPO|nr:hypothetical protein FLONG3_5350 [Fusarium longipes]